MKKVSLIGNVKDIAKIPSFQIAVALVVLESMQAVIDTPLTFAGILQSILLVALPIVRILKKEIK